MARKRKAIPNVPHHTPLYTEGGAMSRTWIVFLQSLFAGPPKLLSGTHAERVDDYAAADWPDGTLFYEDDRNTYYLSFGAAWVWVFGEMRGTLSPDQKPAGLGADDDGFLFYSTDFAHLYRWDAADNRWYYATEYGDHGSGWITWQTAPPNTRGAAGWVLANGATVTRSTGLGSTASVTLPNLVGAFIKGAAAYTGALISAVAPGLTGSTAAAGDHSHTVQVTVTAESAGGGGVGGAQNVGADQVHTGVTDVEGAHTHGKGTLAVDATGQPAHVQLLPYYRL